MRLARLTVLALCAATAVRAGHGGSRSEGISRPEGVGDIKGSLHRTGERPSRARPPTSLRWLSLRPSGRFRPSAPNVAIQRGNLAVVALGDPRPTYSHSVERPRDFEAEKQAANRAVSSTTASTRSCDGECCDAHRCHFSCVCIAGILLCTCWGSYERYCKTTVANWRWKRHAENATQYGGLSAAEQPAYLQQQQPQWPPVAGQPPFHKYNSYA